MPFKSEAQRRKFYAMANRGEISEDTVREWESATPKGKKLPDRVTKKAYDAGVEDALRQYNCKEAVSTSWLRSMINTGASKATMPRLEDFIGKMQSIRDSVHAAPPMGAWGKYDDAATYGLDALLRRGGDPITAGLKLSACEEIRLKLPKREYHGLDEALRSVGRGEKRAEGPTAEQLAEVLREFDEPMIADGSDAAKDPLDRATLWSGPSNLAAGDTANRVSDMGQATQNGVVF